MHGKTENPVITYKKTSNIIDDARTIINSARSSAVRSVDFCRVQMYWNLGKRIFEEEQQGKERADYGTYLVKTLAKNLEKEYGSGFGERQLERARQFYRLYQIPSALRTELNWSQYEMVKMTLPKDNKTILASKYELYLPSEETLKAEVEKLANAQEKFSELTDGTDK